MKMAQSSGQPRLSRPVHLVLDWDATLTMKDTMSTLGKLPQARDIRKGSSQIASHNWHDFSKAYAADYSAHKRLNFPHSSDPQLYSVWLASLREVEDNSAKRVSDSGYFTGVNTVDIDTVAQDALSTGKLQLRKGWLDLFNLFLPDARPPSDSRVMIISVNWSATFIRRSLLLAARSSDIQCKQDLVDYVTHMEIAANELEGLESPSGSTGRLGCEMRTAPDKLVYMPLPAHMSGPRDFRPLVVYVGDSATDYECLRRADVGIWICDCPESEYDQNFRDTFKPLEDEPRPLVDAGVGGNRFRWVDGLEQVVDYLAGLRQC